MHGDFKVRRVRRRHHIQIAATPKTPEARKLLSAFLRQVKAFQRRWEANAKRQEARGKGRRRTR